MDLHVWIAEEKIDLMPIEHILIDLFLLFQGQYEVSSMASMNSEKNACYQEREIVEMEVPAVD